MAGLRDMGYLYVAHERRGRNALLWDATRYYDRTARGLLSSGQTEPQARAALAEILRADLEQRNPLEREGAGATVYADILGHALRAADYYDIAGYITDEARRALERDNA